MLRDDPGGRQPVAGEAKGRGLERKQPTKSGRPRTCRAGPISMAGADQECLAGARVDHEFRINPDRREGMWERAAVVGPDPNG